MPPARQWWGNCCWYAWLQLQCMQHLSAAWPCGWKQTMGWKELQEENWNVCVPHGPCARPRVRGQRRSARAVWLAVCWSNQIDRFLTAVSSRSMHRDQSWVLFQSTTEPFVSLGPDADGTLSPEALRTLLYIIMSSASGSFTPRHRAMWHHETRGQELRDKTLLMLLSPKYSMREAEGPCSP